MYTEKGKKKVPEITKSWGFESRKYVGKFTFFKAAEKNQQERQELSIDWFSTGYRKNKTWFTVAGELIPTAELTLADVVILVKALSTAFQALALAQGQREGTGGAVSGQRSLARGA